MYSDYMLLKPGGLEDSFTYGSGKLRLALGSFSFAETFTVSAPSQNAKRSI